MLLDITFSFQAKVIPPRKRNEVERSYLSTLTVEIPEVTSDELPVAFRWDTKKDWLERDEGMREVRWSEGAGCWAKKVVQEYDEDSEKLPPRDLDAAWLRSQATYGAEAPGRGIFLVAHPRYHAEVPVFMKDVAALGRIVSTTEVERRREIEEAVRQVMLVDGVVYQPAAEPCYEVSGSSGMWDRDRRKWMRVSDAASGAKSPHETYRLDERDYALGANEMHEGQDILIEVLVPEAVRAPLPEMALAAVARELLDAMADKLKVASRGNMMAFVDLREANAAMDGALAEPGGDLASAAETLVGALRDILPHMSELEEHNSTWREKRVEKALDRYDARCMSFDFGEGVTP